MPSISDSAYPRLKSNPSPQDLHEIYTPKAHESNFVQKHTRLSVQRVGLLLLLKTFQRLGYFTRYADIPGPIVRHVAKCAGYSDIPNSMEAYDTDLTRNRHKKLILEFLGVTAYGPAARLVIIDTCHRASRTRDDLPDIINMAIEELVRQRHELPAFSTLLRIARTARSLSNRGYQMKFCESLSEDARHRLLAVLSRPEERSSSGQRVSRLAFVQAGVYSTTKLHKLYSFTGLAKFATAVLNSSATALAA